MTLLSRPAGNSYLDSIFAELAEHAESLQGDALEARNNLCYFSEYVMSWNNPDWSPNSTFIRNVYDTLQDAETNNDPVLVLGPRGSAKSTAVSVTHMLWRIGRNPLIRILMAFASLDQQGKQFIRQQKHVIEENDRYAMVFGELFPGVGRGSVWTDTEYIVRRPTPPSGFKDPTMIAVGIGSTVPSKRADVVDCDDLVNKDNAFSAAQRAKVIAFVVQTLFPILVPGGQKIVVGSRWDPEDFYTYIARQWRLKFPKMEQINTAELLLPLVFEDGGLDAGTDDPDSENDESGMGIGTKGVDALVAVNEPITERSPLPPPTVDEIKARIERTRVVDLAP